MRGHVFGKAGPAHSWFLHADVKKYQLPCSSPAGRRHLIFFLMPCAGKALEKDKSLLGVAFFQKGDIS
ncbi:hypothetical protein SXCC_01305 [Gluconacetobacter sp. SXCC-1]|nr:hypothetical protein SXCC_01305 [Gluconacetobacter sp. SXCC-1]